MSYLPIKETMYALKSYYVDAEEAEKIIISCALVAAGVDAVGGAIPGLAFPATIISCFGAVWVMYGQLCNKLGISLKENVLKILARAALANIVGNLGAAIAALITGLFIPGASILASAVITFVTIYLAGYIFLQLILKMARRSKDPYTFSDISTSEMKKMTKEAKVSKEDLAAAKKAYDENKDKKES